MGSGGVELRAVLGTEGGTFGTFGTFVGGGVGTFNQKSLSENPRVGGPTINTGGGGDPGQGGASQSQCPKANARPTPSQPQASPRPTLSPGTHPQGLQGRDGEGPCQAAGLGPVDEGDAVEAGAVRRGQRRRQVREAHVGAHPHRRLRRGRA